MTGRAGVDAGPLDARARGVIERSRASLDEAERDAGPVPPGLAEELSTIADELGDALRRSSGPDARTAAATCRLLVDVTRLQGELRERVVAQRFGTVARIHRSLSQLRDATSVAELLPAAAEEIGRSCDFDRVAVSRRLGSRWQTEALWIAPSVDEVVARTTREYLQTRWIPLDPGTAESQLVQRRAASLISEDDPGVDRELVDATSSERYVASPLLSGDRVIGFLHADRRGDGRPLDEVDRDNLWTFAEGFGLVFERVALLERLAERRDRVHRTFADAEAGLAALGRDELLLERQDAGAPDAPALGRGPASTVDRVAAVLTVRERQVVDLMARGARNREIAERLVIGEATVKSHVRTIGRKLEATSRADAVARYLRLAATEGPP